MAIQLDLLPPVIDLNLEQLRLNVNANFRRIVDEILKATSGTVGTIPASSVTAGIFNGGDYTFPSDLTVIDTLLVGTAKMGASGAHAGTGWAEWSHSNQWSGGPGSGSTFGFLHNSNGDIIVNAVTGKTVSLNINNVNKAILGASGLNVIDKLSVGNAGGFESEAITVGTSSGLSGISMKDRSAANRWVIYPNAGNLYFYDSVLARALAVIVGTGGELVSGLGHSGESHAGPWLTDRAYACFGNRLRMNTNNSHYLILGGNSNNDTYVAASGPGGYIVFREANNGTNILQMRPGTTIISALPALGGGNTMNLQVGGSEQFGFIASATKYKKNVRKLDTTGSDNPIWKLKPVRFNWSELVVNYEEMDFRYPDGVAGFIAEDVVEVMPDAVLWSDGDQDPWEVNAGRQSYDEWELPRGFGVVEPTGIDNDRLIAYLVDAVQYLKKELEKR
jgi:hypothetical protein